MTMRIAAVTLAASIGLAGCTDPQQANNFVDNVQQNTQKLCGIVPTAKTITALAAILFPGAAKVSAGLATAEEICSGLETAKETDGGVQPVAGGDSITFDVRGVQIEAFEVK